MDIRKRGICIIGIILFAFAIGLLAYYVFAPKKVYEFGAEPQLVYVVNQLYDEPIKIIRHFFVINKISTSHLQNPWE